MKSQVSFSKDFQFWKCFLQKKEQTIDVSDLEEQVIAGPNGRHWYSLMVLAEQEMQSSFYEDNILYYFSFNIEKRDSVNVYQILHAIDNINGYSLDHYSAQVINSLSIESVFHINFLKTFSVREFKGNLAGYIGDYLEVFGKKKNDQTRVRIARPLDILEFLKGKDFLL